MKEVVPPVKVRIQFELINYIFNFLQNNKVPTAGFEPGSPGKRKTTNCEAPALPLCYLATLKALTGEKKVGKKLGWMGEQKKDRLKDSSQQ